MITTLLASLILSCTPPTIHDTKDLDFRVPNFDNAPRFDMQRGLRGRNPIRNQQREERPKLTDRDDALVRLLRKEFGDRYNIIRWKDCIIIKPNNKSGETVKGRKKGRKNGQRRSGRNRR